MTARPTSVSSIRSPEAGVGVLDGAVVVTLVTADFKKRGEAWKRQAADRLDAIFAGRRVSGRGWYPLRRKFTSDLRD